MDEEKEEDFHRNNMKLIPIQPNEYKDNSLWHLIDTAIDETISEYLITQITQKISKNECVNLDTNNNLLNYFAQWYFNINKTPHENRIQIVRELSTKLISTIFGNMTPRQRTNILISFFRKLDVDIPLLPSQRHILSILFDYDFVTTSEKLMKITRKIFKRNLGKRMICSQIILTTTKNKNDERAEESREICFSGIGGIVSTLNRYLDDTVEPVITDTQPGVIGPQIRDMNFRRSKKVSKRSSKKVSKRRSKKVSKRRSKKVSKRSSKKVSKRRSKKVSKRRYKKVSKRRYKKVSKRSCK